METTLTAKLKLTLTPTQFAALRTTGLAYRDALNLVSAYAFAHGKTSSRRRLQDGTYAQIRAQFHLPAQMACNVPRQVAATYKGLWTKVRQNAEARRKGYTKKRYKGLDKPPHYVSPTITYNVGIDVGQRYLATVTTLHNRCQFYRGAEIRHQTDHVARLQKHLRTKGTRSATRKRIALGQRERRLKQQANHVISRQIVDTHPASLLGVEDLTGIRERIKRKTGKRTSKKQRRANRHDSKWAFAELRAFLDYKAQLAGSLCITVDADYTSQLCPRCGWTAKANRPEQGLVFVCQQCQYTLHADLVGARNIALRTLLIRHD